MNNIRVGLLVDDMAAPAWVTHMLGQIAAEQGMEIALIVKYAYRAQPAGKAAAPRDPWLLSLWMEVDRRLVSVPDDAFSSEPLSLALPAVPRLDVEVESKPCGDHFDARDLAQIAGHRINVFLRLGPLRPCGEIFDTASCGIWSFRHGDEPLERGGPVGAWDILLDRPATASALEFQTRAGERGHTLQRSWSMTYPVSIRRNRSRCYWKTLSFVPRKLRELGRIGEENFKLKYAATGTAPAFYSGAPVARPSTFDSGKLIARLVARTVAKKAAALRSLDQWMLLYHFGGENELPERVFEFRQLVPPKDRFWADPFVVERNGEYVVFIEELEYANNRGHLSVIRFDANDEPVLPPVRILARPYHLSYPFMFEEDGELYMIPETNESHAIELYRCTRFPDKWEHVMNLMDGVMAVDTTIWRHDGKYWLFACMRENEHASLSDELFLFWSDSLLTTDWHPHPCNPIVSDIRCARPAGNIFQHHGKWYRPAQDCSGRYGRAMSFQRIDAIDETTYRETPVSRIEPEWDESIVGVHTFNRAGRLTFIDGIKKRG
ncbi:hypothetical protein BGLT_03725 [Caballeronia glathei]|uniref:Formyl transferase n=1 Tax=Caballeronia glathei TaxID=60547 RepID=A0A069PH85_9BURK|nr:hypothetical protein [Caballeronia glathei]KDR39707.1 formyl transferase [Caballeronia glathei]CDY74782.1 hypothetical protein BGLT_03725 [Caballeronia glathei]